VPRCAGAPHTIGSTAARIVHNLANAPLAVTAQGDACLSESRCWPVGPSHLYLHGANSELGRPPGSLSSRVIETSGDPTSGHHALERDDIAGAPSSRSRSLFSRVIQTFGDSTFGHHALALFCRADSRHPWIASRFQSGAIRSKHSLRTRLPWPSGGSHVDPRPLHSASRKPRRTYAFGASDSLQRILKTVSRPFPHPLRAANRIASSAARNKARALWRVSSYSASGSESATTPPPACT
jgi:hypothetical protein